MSDEAGDKGEKDGPAAGAGLGPVQLAVLAIGLIAASSTLDLDLTGFLRMGWSYGIALGLALVLQLAFAIVVSDLAVRHPRAGLLFDYTRAIWSGGVGRGLGRFLGIVYLAVLVFACAGEALAGARVLRELVGGGAHVGFYLSALALVALLGTGFGLRVAYRVVLVLVLVVVGLRLGFGLTGFFGFGGQPAWDPAHLDVGGAADRGHWELVPLAMPLALWSLLGVEVVATLAPSARANARQWPWVLFGALVVSFGSALVFGMGTIGVAPYSHWRALVFGPLHTMQNAPVLVAGAELFGPTGRVLGGVLSLAASLSSLLVVQIAVPRLLAAQLRGALLPPFVQHLFVMRPSGEVHLRGHIAIFVMITLPPWLVGQFESWIASAVYLWLPVQLAFYVLAIASRRVHPHLVRIYPCPVLGGAALLGVVGTLFVQIWAFEGRHAGHLAQSMWILLFAVLAAAWVQRPRPVRLEVEP